MKKHIHPGGQGDLFSGHEEKKEEEKNERGNRKRHAQKSVEEKWGSSENISAQGGIVGTGHLRAIHQNFISLSR